MKNKYRISPSLERIRSLILNENGQLEVIYFDGSGNGNYGFDFVGEPEDAAREACRRVELYNREHLHKIIDVEADCVDVPKTKG
jgi:hypothetical protein